MAEEIKITIGADTTNLEQKLNQAKTSLQKFQTSSAQASQTLQNLSRVAQDAPFGFVAISNNLNPLIESFGRLKQESGSTGKALNSLLSGLTGAGGLALGFGVVTSALTFVQMGLQAWGGSTKKQEEDQKKLNEEVSKTPDYLIEYNNRLKEVTDALIKDTSETARLTLYLQTNNLTIEERKNAIDKLNQSYPEYLNNIDKERASYESLTKEIIKSGQKRALEGILKTDYAKSFTKPFERIQQLQLEIADIKLNPFYDSADDLEELTKLENAIKSEEKVIANMQKMFPKFSQIISQATGLSPDDISKALFGGDEQEIKKVGEKTKKTQDDVIKDLIEGYKDIARFSQAIGEPLQTATFPSFLNSEQIKVGAESLKKEYDLVIKTIETLTKEFNVDPNNALIVKLKTDAADLARSIRIIEDGVRLKNLKVPEVTVPTQIKGKPINFKIEPSDLEKTLKEAGVQIERLVNDLAFNIAENIGAALAGSNIDFLGSFLQILGNGLVQVGKLLLKIAGLAELVQKALSKLFTGPQGAILAGVAGFALIALGSAIKNLKTSSFAVGTRFAP